MMAMTALLVQQVLLVQPGQWVNPVHVVRLAQQELLVQRAPQAQRETLVQWVTRVLLELQALREIKVILDQKDQRVLG